MQPREKFNGEKEANLETTLLDIFLPLATMSQLDIRV